MSDQIFVSYARADAATTSAIMSEVSAISTSGWKGSSDLSTGKAVVDTVRDALRQASAVVVMISPKSLANQWVQFELGAAQALDKHIIPVIIDGNDVESKMPNFLRRLQYVDARKKPGKLVAREIEKMVKRK